MLRFKQLKTKIHLFVLGFLVIMLLLVLFLINRANMQNAVEQVLSDMRANGNTFISAFADMSTHLRVTARLLSSDYAFKQAYATHDHDTILSAMRNHLSRLEQADIMMAFDIDSGEVLIDTSGHHPVGSVNPVATLIAQAEEDDYLEAVGFGVLEGVLYQFVVVPLLVPDPDAWIVTGFRIDDGYLQRFKELSLSDVTLYTNKKLLASTQQNELRQAVMSWLGRESGAGAHVAFMAGENYLTLLRALDQRAGVSVILQRSLDRALRPYTQLQYSLAVVFSVAILLAYFGSSLLAKNISTPVRSLAEFAHRVERGEYDIHVEVSTEDEIGQLGQAFNHMTKSIGEKEQMRNLLGKVVSPEIARQLIEHGVELGGEEKQVTVLFSDLRNFTSLCEGCSAGQVVTLLNRYLNVMSSAIESHHGVVDKYIGDAVMALYGAPLTSQDDASNAVVSALQMKAILGELNRDFRQQGLPEIDMGIGINTDGVVAGNMGSQSRLNYTVIGDGVNLASRLEGLTKHYGVKILVSHSTVQLTPDIAYREIDKVQVKGKNEPVVIYEPYDPADDELLAGLAAYQRALAVYQEGRWDEGQELFARLTQQYPQHKLYQVYWQRCKSLAAASPDIDWDGVYRFTSK